MVRDITALFQLKVHSGCWITKPLGEFKGETFTFSFTEDTCCRGKMKRKTAGVSCPLFCTKGPTHTFPKQRC